MPLPSTAPIATIEAAGHKDCFSEDYRGWHRPARDVQKEVHKLIDVLNQKAYWYVYLCKVCYKAAVRDGSTLALTPYIRQAACKVESEDTR